jgi:DNA-binding NarL/FixJ family response regulator
MSSRLSSPQNDPTRSVRVLLVDDSVHVRQELRQLLELSGAVQVVGEAGDGLEAVRLSRELAPAVIVMDLAMPVLDGLEATRQIKSQVPSPRVVILSVHGEPAEAERARRAGADCFITKGSDYQILVNAILSRDGPNYSVEKGDKS